MTCSPTQSIMPELCSAEKEGEEEEEEERLDFHKLFLPPRQNIFLVSILAMLVSLQPGGVGMYCSMYWVLQWLSVCLPVCPPAKSVVVCRGDKHTAWTGGQVAASDCSCFRWGPSKPGGKSSRLKLSSLVGVFMGIPLNEDIYWKWCGITNRYFWKSNHAFL